MVPEPQKYVKYLPFGLFLKNLVNCFTFVRILGYYFTCLRIWGYYFTYFWSPGTMFLLSKEISLCRAIFGGAHCPKFQGKGPMV